MDVVAMLPGTIQELKVTVGDTVNADDVLLVMEVMKMEQEIEAPQAGEVKEIKVAAGDTVSEGDVMIVIG